jgi:anti-sigma regulatory factor (Ser/Thr protein kinase)
MQGQTLDFALLDDLALAVQRRRLGAQSFLRTTKPDRIGPLLELLILGREGSLDGLSIGSLPASTIVAQLGRALAPKTIGTGIHDADFAMRAGFITTSRDPESVDQTPWIAFCREAQVAAEFCGLHKQHAQGLVGAMREIEDNVHQHSQRARDGIVAYRATKDEFEFVVADSGIGALASFRQSPHYAQLLDAGTAIRLALTDGESRFRHQDSGRGYGFHDLFVGLANLNGRLRFRSDDHALTIDGASPSLVGAHLSQTVRLRGFVASVVCCVDSSAVLH